MRVALLCLLASACFIAPASAQEAPLFESGEQRMDAGTEFLGDSLLVSEATTDTSLDTAESAAEPMAVLDAGDPARGGRWRVVPRLDVKGTFDDNIFIQPDNEVSDYILTLAPGATFGFWDSDEERERYLDRRRGGSIVERARGSFVAVEYTAILLGFARTDSQNTLDHDGAIAGRWQNEKLTLGASIHLEAKSETNVDVGDRVRRNTATSAITARYQLTGKTSAGLELHHRLNDPEDYARTQEWRVESSLDQELTPLVRLGVGVALGQVEVQGGADSVFERLLARSTYALTEKFEAEFRGGVEFRQSEGPSGDRANPVFELRTTWTPAVETEIGLEGFRRVQTSIEQVDRDFTSTGVLVSVRQAVRGGVSLDLAGGYELADYEAESVFEERRDRYWFVRPGIWWNVAAWASAGVTYEHRRNDSSRDSSDFVNNQTALQLSLTY